MSKNDGIVKLHGREYRTVALRVQMFREQFPLASGWRLKTEPHVITEEIVIFRAAVINPEGHEVATGYAEEKRTNRGINSTSALENCETSALGRALASAGLGGSEYASADELAGAISQQRQPQRTQQPQPAPKKGPVITPPEPGNPGWFAIECEKRKIVKGRLVSWSEGLERGNPFDWSMKAMRWFLAEWDNEQSKRFNRAWFQSDAEDRE